MADLTKEALVYLVDTGKKLSTLIEKDYEGRKYIDRELVPVRAPLVTPLGISTLGSLIELCSGKFENDAAFEGFNPRKHVIHVVNEKTVQVVTAQSNIWKNREVLINCALAEVSGLEVNKFLPQDKFIIMLLSAFTDSGDKEGLAKLAGNATAEHVSTVVDDGITQVVSMRAGANVSREDGTQVVKGLVRLAPWRTFRDVAQPISSFLFRVKKSGEYPEFALYEADGGAWRLEAVDNIARKISAALTDATVVS